MAEGQVDYRLRNANAPQLDESPFFAADWTDPPKPRSWLVEGCFGIGQVALISSDGGLGKSLLMQQLCTAAVLGKPWLGLECKRVKAFALFCEDDKSELHRRQVSINRHYGCNMGDFESNLAYIARPGHNNIMVEFEKWTAKPKMTPGFKAVLGQSMAIGAQIIVLDTASDVFGGNEIARDQVRAFITLLRGMAIKLNACVILTAHVSNEGLATGSGLSGSRAWSNSVRSRLWLTEKKADAGGDIRYLKGMKANYSKRMEAMKLQYQGGVFVRADQPLVKDFSEPTWADEPI